VIGRRLLVAALVVAVLSGCAPEARLLAKQQADQLEESLEAVPGITNASATVNKDAIGLRVNVDVPTEDDYLALLQQVVDVWVENPLAQRKSLSLNATPEGTFSFSNVEPDDLDNVLAAARILWHYWQDPTVDITTSTGSNLAARQLGLTLLVADESQLAPTLAELTAAVEEAGLLYRPGDGLVVELRRS
jgi:hypothetical protein